MITIISIWVLCNIFWSDKICVSDGIVIFENIIFGYYCEPHNSRGNFIWQEFNMIIMIHWSRMLSHSYFKWIFDLSIMHITRKHDNYPQLIGSERSQFMVKRMYRKCAGILSKKHRSPHKTFFIFHTYFSPLVLIVIYCSNGVEKATSYKLLFDMIIMCKGTWEHFFSWFVMIWPLLTESDVDYIILSCGLYKSEWRHMRAPTWSQCF